MGTFSDKICRENKNTHIRFENVSSKIAPFMRSCGKISYSWTGYR